MATTAAGGADAAHPSHLVIFQKPSERNEEVLTWVTKLKRRKEAQVSSGIMSFGSSATGRSQARLFRSLAVAAVEMSEETAAELQQQEPVAIVVRNQIRSIPRPRTPDLIFPDPMRGPASDAALMYLRGMRDAADMALNFLGAGGGEPMFALRMPLAPAALSVGTGWPLPLIGITPNYRLTGRGVTVAVLDTGIDFGHPDFSGRVQDGVTAHSFVKGVASAQDGHGHGTHCAGVVAGPLSPAQGERYGVAPDVSLLVGKVLDDSGYGYDDDIVEGIQWAADNGARIISMSLGSPRAPGAPFSPLYESIAEQLFTEGQGILLVAASGNESERPYYTKAVGNPAACPSIMGIGAVDRATAIAKFSDCQMDDIGLVDVVAPGVAIRSSWTGGGYWSDSGTSMACPHVSGVAALFLEDNPALSAQDLKEAILAKARKLGRVEDFGKGLIQVP